MSNTIMVKTPYQKVFFTPFTVSIKLLLKECWDSNLEWDEEFSKEFKSRILSFLKDVDYLKSFTLQRWFQFDNTCSSVQLCVFGDASTSAYVACAYLYFFKFNKVHSVLLCSKSRLVKKGQHTVPRLELLAAILVTRLSVFVQAQLPSGFISKVNHFSDSSIVLNWIHGSKKALPTFVENRITEINKKTSTKSWRHVKSLDNPADIGTRHNKSVDWLQSDLW